MVLVLEVTFELQKLNWSYHLSVGLQIYSPPPPPESFCLSLLAVCVHVVSTSIDNLYVYEVWHLSDRTDVFLCRWQHWRVVHVRSVGYTVRQLRVKQRWDPLCIVVSDSVSVTHSFCLSKNEKGHFLTPLSKCVWKTLPLGGGGWSGWSDR
jgi:hypothetical protein